MLASYGMLGVASTTCLRSWFHRACAACVGCPPPPRSTRGTFAHRMTWRAYGTLVQTVVHTLRPEIDTLTTDGVIATVPKSLTFLAPCFFFLSVGLSPGSDSCSARACDALTCRSISPFGPADIPDNVKACKTPKNKEAIKAGVQEALEEFRLTRQAEKKRRRKKSRAG